MPRTARASVGGVCYHVINQGTTGPRFSPRGAAARGWELSRWMQWLLNAHVRRYHKHYRGSGHIWQGRFKAFPIQKDEHLVTVLRYVERNPVRAALARKAENWLWSSARYLTDADARPTWLADPPIERGDDWLARE